jgi:hypothetical protein
VKSYHWLYKIMILLTSPNFSYISFQSYMLSNDTIIFQHPVALVNCLFHRGSLQGALLLVFVDCCVIDRLSCIITFLLQHISTL